MIEENKLATLEVPNELATYLQGKEVSDGVDADELGSVPVLRVVQRNSNNVETVDGQDAAPGELYYKPTKNSFKELDVHILTVKQCVMKSKVFGTDDEYEDKSHYIITGVIADTNEPFVTYVKGMSYSSVWELLEDTRPFRKHPSTPVPMFALKIQLSTVKEDGDYGPVYVLKYDVVRDKTGQPELVDLKTYKWLEAQLSSSKQMVETLIDINKRHGSDLENEDVTIVSENEPDVEDVSDDVPF